MAVGRRWRRAAALLAGAAACGGETPWTQEADTMLAEADNLQQQGQWGPALEKYKSALRVSPQPPASHMPCVPVWLFLKQPPGHWTSSPSP